MALYVCGKDERVGSSELETVKVLEIISSVVDVRCKGLHQDVVMVGRNRPSANRNNWFKK